MTSTQIRLIASSALVLSGLTVTQAKAAGGWGPPQTLVGTEQLVSEPQITSDAAGDVALGWTQGNRYSRHRDQRVQLAFRKAGGAAFSAPVTLGSPGSILYGLGMAKDGTTVAVWRSPSAIEAAIRSWSLAI